MHQKKLSIADTVVVFIINAVLKLRGVRSTRAQGDAVFKVRDDLEKLAAVVSKVHQKASVSKDRIEGVSVEWIKFNSFNTGRVLLYSHGGGYVIGSPSSHRAMISQISWHMKATTIVPDYRLAPEHPYPAGLDDTYAVYRFLIENGTRPENLIIAGDSAGGGMTLALLQRLKKEKMPMPAAVCCLSPWADLTQSGGSHISNDRNDYMLSKALLSSFAGSYTNGADRQNSEISPVAGDYSNMPPILIQVGTEEVLLDDSRKVAAASGAAGNDVEIQEWHKMQHVWQYNFRFLNSARKAIRAMGAFVDAKMG